MYILHRKGRNYYMIQGHVEVRHPNPIFTAMGGTDVTVGVVDGVTHLIYDPKCSPRSKKEFNVALALCKAQIAHIPYCRHAPNKGDRCPYHCRPSKEFAENADRETLILEAFEAAQVF